MKCAGIKKVMCVVLIFTFIVGQVEMGYASQNLATWTVTGENPMRPESLNDIAKKFDLGAVGNGRPLVDLVKGNLPPEIELTENHQKEIVKKLRAAVNLAIFLHLKNRDKIPPAHQNRASETLINLFSFRSNLEKNLYFYDAFGTVTSPEDYLAGFSYGKKIGKDPLLVNRFYSKSVLRLAQDIYHDCVPEYLKGKHGKSLSEEVNQDHKIIYQEIQPAIFGEYEVKALGEDYRAFIEEALFLKEEVTEIIKLAKEYMEEGEMEETSEKVFNSFTSYSLNPIVRTIGISALYWKAEAGSGSANMILELPVFTEKKEPYSIDAAIAQSVLYEKAKLHSSDNLNKEEALKALKFIQEHGINSIAREIAEKTLEEKKSLMEILSDIQDRLLEERNVYESARMAETVKYEKIMALDESLLKYAGRKVSDKEKPEVSKKINELIKSGWNKVDMNEPFTDDNQKNMEIIVELDKFRVAKGMPILDNAYYEVCYARLFSEENWQYVIDFMREVKKFSGEQTRTKSLIFNNEHFLQLYLVSCFRSAEIFHKAEKKQFEMKQSMKFVIFRVALDELLGEGSSSVYANEFSEESLEILGKIDRLFTECITFYEKTGQYEKAIEFIDIMLRTSLLSERMNIDGEERCISENCLTDFSPQKEMLVKWRNKIVKKRNASSKLVQFMKEFRGEDASYPYFSLKYEQEFPINHRKGFTENDSKFTAILQEIESIDSHIRLGGLSQLIDFRGVINLDWGGGTVVDLIYEEALSVFEALSGFDGDAEVMRKTEINNWADFLRKIASLYLKRDNRAKVLEIAKVLESKMKAIKIANNDICPALADIRMDLKMYDEAEESILKIDNEATQIRLLIRMGDKQAKEARTMEAARTLRKARMILEKFCDGETDYKRETLRKISVIEGNLKNESAKNNDTKDIEGKSEKRLQNATYFPAGLRFLPYTDLGKSELEGKVVYVRFACDVPFDEKKTLKDPSRITDPMRIDVALPSLEHVVLNGGKVVFQPGWIKRPDGVDINLSVIPVFLDIRKKLLDKGVIKTEEEMILVPTDLETEEARSIYRNIDEIQRTVQRELREGTKVKIVCFDNPRFDKEYDKGNQDLTEKIAEMVDFAIFDDYNQLHRPVSDIKFLPRLVPSYVGKHLREEIQIADQLLKKIAEPNRKPFLLLLGGKKIETKPGKVSKVTVALNLINRGLMRKGDKILIGGGVSYAFMVAEKYLELIKNDSGEIDDSKVKRLTVDDIKDVIGDSYISDKPLDTDEGLEEARVRISTFAKLLVEAKRRGIKVTLPRVHKIRNIKTGKVRTGQTKIPRGWYGIDIDGTSIEEYEEEIKGIGIGIMAGPMGIMDDPDIPEAVKGTNEILKALAEETRENDAFTLSAGGETTWQAFQIGAELTYRSVGGGMTLEVIEQQGETHGLLALSESARKFSGKVLKNADDVFPQHLKAGSLETLFLSDEVGNAIEIVSNCCESLMKSITPELDVNTIDISKIEEMLTLERTTPNPIVSVISGGMIYGMLRYGSDEEERLRHKFKSIIGEEKNSITAAIAQGILYRNAVMSDLKSKQDEEEAMEQIMKTATNPIAREISRQILKTKKQFLEIVGDVRKEVLEERQNHALSANAEENKIDMICQAEFLKYNLLEWRKKHPDEVLVIAIDNDIGKKQQDQIMPLWKITDAIKKMRDSSGELLFPKEKFKDIRRSGSNGDLMRDINDLLDNEKTVKENIFLVGQKANIDTHQFDSLKKASWIAGIDDTGVGMEIYLPVFEALTLMIMSKLGASEASIKEYYDEISGKEISMRLLREMIKNKVIYVFPKMDRKIKNLRQLYEIVLDIHIAV